MEQPTQKRVSKEKASKSIEPDERASDGAFVEDPFRSRFQQIELRAEAQENEQRDLSARVTRMQSNVEDIKQAINGISANMGDIFQFLREKRVTDSVKKDVQIRRETPIHLAQ